MGTLFPFGEYITDGIPYEVEIIDEETGLRPRGEVTFEHYGYPRASVFFSQDTSLWGKNIVPALNGMAEEVSRTIELCALLLP
jgi:hypothetical protein